jgi:hypothetical protein
VLVKFQYQEVVEILTLVEIDMEKQLDTMTDGPLILSYILTVDSLDTEIVQMLEYLQPLFKQLDEPVQLALEPAIAIWDQDQTFI